MTNSAKKELLASMLEPTDVSYYKVLKELRAFKVEYMNFMTTNPVNVDVELTRVATADYDLCAAIVMLLLREDHFSEGAFARRRESGQFAEVINRMIYLLD